MDMACTVVGGVAVGCSAARFIRLLGSIQIFSLFRPSGAATRLQAFVRWSSPESLRLYARWDLTYQAKRRDELSGAHVTSVNTVRRGLIEPTLTDIEAMRSIADDIINAE
jgi:hypothetical protein